MNEITYKLLNGETINNKDLMPVLEVVKKELKFAKQNATIVLNQIKKVE